MSSNRLLAEAMCAALASGGVVSSYVHVRDGREEEYLGSIIQEPTIVALDVSTYSDHSQIFYKIRRLAQQLPASRIIVFGDGRSPESVTGCIESGASTYVLPCDSLGELTATVKSLRDGYARCSSTVIKAVLQRIRELSAANPQHAKDEAVLTQREIEVLELVEQGLLNKEVARRLGIAISTVKNHLHAIFEKLQVAGRRQAVRQSIASGLLRRAPRQIVA